MVRGMPQNRNRCRTIVQNSLVSRAGRRAALAALVVCAGTAAAWAGDNDGTMSAPSSFYDKMMQVIGVDNGPNIDYSARSPLVVPPTRYLPPPQPDRPPAVADWPHDPDMARAAQARAKEKITKPVPDYELIDALPLRPDQLNAPLAHGGPSTAAASGGVGTPYNPDSSVERQKSDLFSLFRNPFSSKTEYATFTGAPPRSSLIDPPPGYMVPSPDQPYGVGPAQAHYKIPTVADRMTPQSGSVAGGQ
jgi:hypothetical protein